MLCVSNPATEGTCPRLNFATLLTQVSETLNWDQDYFHDNRVLVQFWKAYPLWQNSQLHLQLYIVHQVHILATFGGALVYLTVSV